MSTRLFSRDAKTEASCQDDGSRGFVLIGALVVALLYFALLELMLIEAVQAMRASQRFRARVVAQVLAENAAELVAHQLVFSSGKKVQIADETGTMIAESRRLINDQFEIEASGMITGAVSQPATVAVFGRIQGTSVRVDRTIHSQ